MSASSQATGHNCLDLTGLTVTTSITLAGWVKVNAFDKTAFDTICEIVDGTGTNAYTATSRSIAIQQDPDGTGAADLFRFFWFNASGGGYASTSDAITTSGVWKFIVLSQSGTTVNFHVGNETGALNNIGTFTADFSASVLTRVRIGSDHAATPEDFNGSFRGWRLWIDHVPSNLTAERDSSTFAAVDATGLVSALPIASGTSPGTASSGSNFTLIGALADDASNPSFSASAPTALPILAQQRAPGFPPGAPLPGIARIGVGNLVPAIAAPSIAPPVSPPLPVQKRAKGFPRQAPLPGIALLGAGILVSPTPAVVNAAGTATASPSSFDASGSATLSFDSGGSAAVMSFAAAANNSFAIPAPMAQPGPRFIGTPSRQVAPPPVILGSGSLASSPQSANVSGTATAACSPFAASAAGALTFTASGSAATSSFAATASGAEAFSGSGSAALSSVAVAATGAEAFSGSGSIALSSFASDASSTFAIPAQYVRARPALIGYPSLLGRPAGVLGSGFLSADSPIPQTIGAAATSPFAVSAAGLLAFVSTGTVSPSSFASSSSGSEAFAASGSASLSPFAATGAAAQGNSAVGSAALSPFAVSGSATESFASTGSAALSPFAVIGTTINGFDAIGNAAISPFAVTATGAESFDGIGSAAGSSFAITAVGIFALPAPYASFAQPGPRTFGFPGQARVGSPASKLGLGVLATDAAPVANVANIAVSPFAVTAAGLLTFTSTGSAAVASFAPSGSVAETNAATGAVACSPFASNAAAAQGTTCSGAASTSPFACAASGSANTSLDSTGSAAISSFACAGSGTAILSVTSTGSAALSPFADIGIGAIGAFVNATGGVALSPFAAAAASAEAFLASGAAAVASFSVTSTSSQTLLASGAAAISPFAVSGVGFLGDFIGVASVDMSSFAVLGAPLVGGIPGISHVLSLAVAPMRSRSRRRI